MKTNFINKRSFGAIYIYGPKKPSKLQKKITNKILDAPGLTEKLVKDLEQINTDIVVLQHPLGDAVELKLYTDLDFFGKKIIPYDGRYTSKMETFLNPSTQNEMIINMKINNFFCRAKDMDLGSDKNLSVINSAIYGKHICI